MPTTLTRLAAQGPKLYTQAQVDRMIAKAVLVEFDFVVSNRPCDPCYWDMHHRDDLLAATKRGKEKRDGKQRG
jgi:hypothetical protein